MSKRSMVKLASTLLAASLVLSACGGKPSTDPTPTPPPASDKPKEEVKAPAEPVNVEFWFAIGGRGRDWINATVEEFNASQKEVVVTATYQGDYYTNHQKLSTAIAAKAAPAMSMIEVASIPFFADNGVLADIKTLAKPEELADFLPGLMKEAEWKGQTIAIPFNRSVPILYLNTTALKEANLDPAGPKNWEELREYAKKLTIVKDGQVERWGFLTPVDIWFYEAMVFQAGGSFYSDDLKKATFNSEAGQKALQFWVDLIHTDKVMEMPQGEKYNAWDVTTQGLNTGKAAMIYSTTGRLNNHLKGTSENGFEMATAFLPSGPAGYATPTGGANVVILNTVPKAQQEAAWKFLAYATSAEKAADFAKATGYVPVTNGGVKLMEDYFKEVPQAKTAVDFLQYAKSRPQAPSYAEVQETVMKALQKAVLGEASVKEALDEAAALADKMLK